MAYWTVEETSLMLNVWGTKRIQLLLNNPFSEIANELTKRGVAQYDARDVRIQLDCLTKQYHAAQLSNNATKFMFYDVMDGVLKGVCSRNEGDPVVEDRQSQNNHSNEGTSGSESKSWTDLCDSIHDYSRQSGEHCALIRCSENTESQNRLTFHVEGSKVLQNAVFHCLAVIESVFNELSATKQCVGNHRSNRDDHPIGQNEKPEIPRSYFNCEGNSYFCAKESLTGQKEKTQIIRGFFHGEEDSENLDGGAEASLPVDMKNRIDYVDDNIMSNRDEPQTVDVDSDQPQQRQHIKAENYLQEKESKNEDCTRKKSHKSVHGKFMCEICSANFKSKRRYDCHMSRHAKLKSALICSMCKVQFENENQLSEHEAAKICLVQSNKSTECHLCPTCHMVFSTGNELRSHRKKVQFESEGQLSELEAAKICWGRPKHSGRRCRACPAVFGTKKELRIHRNKEHRERMQTRPYVCEQCNASYRYKGSLAAHVRSKHSEEKPDVAGCCDPCMCDVCGKQLGSWAALRDHKQQHFGYLFSCDICGRGFARRATMMSHRRMHTGETPYLCSDCGKAFRCTSTLNKHRQTHTGVRPFECPHCDKNFIRSSALTQHIRTHTGESPYECLFSNCPFRAKLSSNMNRHMKLVHGYQKPPKPWQLAATITTSGINEQPSQETLYEDTGLLPEAN